MTNRANNAAMFGTNGFVKVSDRTRHADARWRAAAAADLGGLRKVRSDPVLPRIESSKKLIQMDVDLDDGTVRRRHRTRTDSKVAPALLPPARLEEVTNEALASIEGIRSSMEHFQGRREGHEQDAQPQEDPDALEDLQYRLACYRYSRRIEPPPPPLGMDPTFEPAPPRVDQMASIQRPSASHLESFLPQRRRVKLAEQAETRRLRLESAKVKRQLNEQEQSEKVVAEVDRYLQRMDRFDVEKRACRAGGVAGQVAGRRRSLISLSLDQQLEERRKRFFQICAAAAFCHRGTKLLDNFASLSQVCLMRFNTLLFQEKGFKAKTFVKDAALMIWRSSYASIKCEELEQRFGEAPMSPRSPSTPGSPRSPSHGRSGLLLEPHGPILRRLPLLEKGEVLQFLRRITWLEAVLETKIRIRRRRTHAKCIHTVLQSWHPFAIQRMLRHVAACVKRLQSFLRRALLRIKAIYVAVKAQMLQLEREHVEKELQEEEAKNADPKRKGTRQITAEQVTRALLPDSWRSQILDSLLRSQRRHQLQLLKEWRVDMSTYHWEVLEWRKTGHALPCPVMPAYPTHVPSAKVLVKLILEARQLRKSSPGYFDLSLLQLHLSSRHGSEPGNLTGAQWHRSKTGEADDGEGESFGSKVIEPLLTPKGRLLR